MGRIKRKHHFLSKFYLEGFCDSQGMVWMYKKSKPDCPTSAKPKNTAYEKGLYHIEPNENIDDINFIEDLLAEEVESKAANALKKLRDKQFPQVDEREQLSLFFGTLMIRTPGYLRHLQSQFDKELNLISHIRGKPGYVRQVPPLSIKLPDTLPSNFIPN